ncbi:hypothetical protein L9F63_004024, partial [Diploptera punctata]
GIGKSPQKGKMTVVQRSGPMSTTSSLSPSATPPSGEHDLISTASSALRRLHFKSAGGSKLNKKHQQTQQPVPKVVIMGSSTTSTSSNNTINTSTDSANTVATMITVTDGDTDTETDKKYNHIDDILSNSLSLEKDEEFMSGSSTEDSNPIPPPPTPLLGAVSKEQHFIFVRTEVEDEEFENHDDDKKISLLKSSIHNNKNVKDDNVVTKSPRSSRRRHKRKTDGAVQAKNSSNLNGHPPPPDLRVDFFSEPGLIPVTSPEEGKPLASTVVLATSSSSTTTVLVKTAGGGCGGEKGVASCGTNITGGSHVVNTTTNPLGIAALPSRQTTATTIVVQQPSVTGGSPTIATVLLKNCGGASAGVTDKQREENMKQLLDVANTLTLQELHDFEMKIECDTGSPHHSRSQSVKTPGSRSNSGRPNYLCLPQQRSRVASMPNTGVEEEYYRLRHFSITGKGVVNRGDSLKSRRSRSNNSVTSSNSSHSTELLTAAVGGAVTGGGSSYPGSARTSATTSLASSRESSTSNPGPTTFRVVMLGSAAVGKSSLINQFMTSEYLHAYDTSLDLSGYQLLIESANVKWLGIKLTALYSKQNLKSSDSMTPLFLFNTFILFLKFLKICYIKRNYCLNWCQIIQYTNRFLVLFQQAIVYVV